MWWLFTFISNARGWWSATFQVVMALLPYPKLGACITPLHAEFISNCYVLVIPVQGEYQESTWMRFETFFKQAFCL